MPQTIDVTGLTPEAVQAVQNVVDALRGQPAAPPVSQYGPPPGETAEAWIARFTARVKNRPWSDVIADDSRESIYDRSSE